MLLSPLQYLPQPSLCGLTILLELLINRLCFATLSFTHAPFFHPRFFILHRRSFYTAYFLIPEILMCNKIGNDAPWPAKIWAVKYVSMARKSLGKTLLCQFWSKVQLGSPTDTAFHEYSYLESKEWEAKKLGLPNVGISALLASRLLACHGLPDVL